MTARISSSGKGDSHSLNCESWFEFYLCQESPLTLGKSPSVFEVQVPQTYNVGVGLNGLEGLNWPDA